MSCDSHLQPDLASESAGNEVIAWHYTTGWCFKRIVESGCLLPATAGVPDGEKPAVWFTLNQFWEPTANKGWTGTDGTRRTLTREETCQQGAGLVRFGVSLKTARYDWREFKKLSGIRPLTADGLARAARQAGSNPDNWRVSFEPVPGECWVAVDVWDSEKNGWVRVLKDGSPVTPVDVLSPSVTASTSVPKVGPNSRCACGSGKKFKKCCRDLAA